MPSWSGILEELSEGSLDDFRTFERVRRDYLFKLSEFTGRDTILYATSWLQRQDVSPEMISIVDEDIQALMEVTEHLRRSSVDLILHSPGGSPEAAEAIVGFLRSRFRDVRVIVPNLAMSAATMIACSGNRIVMGKHSFLGPTDPQILMQTPVGMRMVAAQAVLAQFKKVKSELTNREDRHVWGHLISQYGPDLIVKCENAMNLSRKLVRIWLHNFMFESQPDRIELSEKISKWLADHSKFMSNSRHLPRDQLVQKGLVIDNLEDCHELQDLSLSVFHATTHLFIRFKVGKVVENQFGRAFIKS